MLGPCLHAQTDSSESLQPVSRPILSESASKRSPDDKPRAATSAPKRRLAGDAGAAAVHSHRPAACFAGRNWPGRVGRGPTDSASAAAVDLPGARRRPRAGGAARASWGAEGGGGLRDPRHRRASRGGCGKGGR